MRKTAHRGFEPTNYDLRIREQGADAVAVNDSSAVGTSARLAAGGIGVITASAFGGGVVSDHRVDVSPGHPPAVSGRAKPQKIRVFDRLGNHRNFKAERLQQAGDDRNTKARMVNICVASDTDKIGLLPAACTEIRICQG